MITQKFFLQNWKQQQEEGKDLYCKDMLKQEACKVMKQQVYVDHGYADFLLWMLLRPQERTEQKGD